MTWEAFGLENFSRLMTRHKQVKKVFNDRGKFALELTKRSIEWGTELLWIWDDYAYKSGPFMSPKSFERYIFPWLRQICDYAHKNGVKILLHSCGDILPIFKDLIDCGIDAFNPIEPTTANPDYDIFKLKEKYGKKITLIGNLNPQDLVDKNPYNIVESTKKLIKECGPGGGFILASGHSIFPRIKLENFLAMRETAIKFGNYPIKIPDS
jgi:uroporphyrinogen decarboxylase